MRHLVRPTSDDTSCFFFFFFLSVNLAPVANLHHEHAQNTSATEAMVQEGLKVGKKVIVHSGDSVSEGKQVRERQK